MEEAAGGGQDCARERSVVIRDGKETEVAEGAGEQIEVFVLFFLCRKDLEHGSGGGGVECGGRTAVKVVEEEGEREVGEREEDRGTRLSMNTVSDSFVRLFDCSTVRLFVSSMVTLSGCSTVRLSDCFTVRLSGCSMMRLSVSSMVTLSVSSTVTLSGCSMMRLSDSSMMTLSGSKMELLHCS